MIYNIILISGVQHSDSVLLQTILHWKSLLVRAVNSLLKARLAPICPCVFLTTYPVVISGFLCPRAGFLWGYLGLLPFLIPPPPPSRVSQCGGWVFWGSPAPPFPLQRPTEGGWISEHPGGTESPPHCLLDIQPQSSHCSKGLGQPCPSLICWTRHLWNSVLRVFFSLCLCTPFPFHSQIPS